MDKNAIKKFAVWARNELIERVSKKAMVYGIAENEVIDPNADSVNGIVLTAAQKKERQALIELIFAKGYQQVMEEVAYTWFNRFCALRFMEVNNYLPSLVRVFTNNKNEFRPQILTEALEVDLEGLDKAKLYELKEANADEELYKYLLITQCNALNKELPKMFQKIEDYTELLFPDNLLREGSVVEQMIKLIPEEDWKDAVQIIGWLYQYYNIEPKNAVFANLKKNIKISKKDIPAATQLFTPDWIVRYMVENSLGRMWVEGHPDDELKAGWKYYLEEAQQEPEVEQELVKIREQYASLQVSDIKCIDPCMGSGHILAYMFDVLMEIYKKEGYRNRDAVKNIINCNLYGLDIDERAAQLAYFAVMMKGRQYDDRFLERNYQPHVHEGMAVGVIYAGFLAGNTSITAAGALALSIGIAIQNFPEGAIISMPLRAEGESKSRAFWGGVLSGVVEPIGAVLTILAAQFVIPVLPYLLSFAAGAMLYVVVEELIPEMSQGEHSNIGTIFFAVGFSVMMVLDVALG